jgi:hypothetical protein
MDAMIKPEARLPIWLWGVALGGAGFIAGFFGPIALNPEANQGPLLGIFITGPGGLLGGFVLGAIFRFLPVKNVTRLQALAAACVVLSVGTLYFCLPEPAVRAYVIDAQVEGCASPTRSFDAALANWEEAVARTTWYTPPADWKTTARRNVERDSGVVLTMHIARRATIYQHRKPWNDGLITAGPWVALDGSERYYASDEGSSCAGYLARARDLYTPFSNSSSSPNEPARVWPPTETTGFLGLMELGPVPAEYRQLLN